MKKLKPCDWEVYQMSDTYFQASQLDERGVFSLHRTFASENEVQAFVQECRLVLIGTGTHGIWPTRQYRAKL